MKTLLLSFLLGCIPMSQAKPYEVKNIYSFQPSSPITGYPTFTNTYIITTDNKLVFADLEGIVKSKGKPNKPNTNFGVYTTTLSKEDLLLLDNANLILKDQKFMDQFKNGGATLFNYSIAQNFNKNRFSGFTFFQPSPQYEKKLNDGAFSSLKEKDNYSKSNALSKGVIAISNPDRKKSQLLGTVKITYNLQQLDDALRVNVNYKTIGNINASTVHPNGFKSLEIGEEMDALKEWMLISYMGVYKDESYNTRIYLLPKYLDKNSLSKDEVDSNFIKLIPNGIKTISYTIPYKDISFYSSKDKGYLKWNEGNRKSTGGILFDHAALQGSWYMQMTLDQFTGYVLHENEELTQLK